MSTATITSELTSSHILTFSTPSEAGLTIFDFQDYQVTLPESLITHGSNRRLVDCATWWMLSILAGINTVASRYLRISIGRSDKSAIYQVVSSVPAEHIGTHFAALFCSPFRYHTANIFLWSNQQNIMDYDSDVKVTRSVRRYEVYRGTSPTTQNRLEVSNFRLLTES